MNGDGEFSELQHKMEQIFGYPAGAFNPSGMFFKDKARIDKALGQATHLFQDVITPQDLAARLRRDVDRAMPTNLQMTVRRMNPLNPPKWGDGGMRR